MKNITILAAIVGSALSASSVFADLGCPNGTSPTTNTNTTVKTVNGQVGVDSIHASGTITTTTTSSQLSCQPTQHPAPAPASAPKK